MSGTVGTFSVDLDELHQVVADVEACGSALERLTADLERQVAALHEVWEGLAAQAQREAHAEWEQGMRAMRPALDGLRAAAATAHANYTGAADANVRMWEQLS